MGVKVYVVKLKGRPFALRWFDPATQAWKQESSGTFDRGEAENKAATLGESRGEVVPVEQTTWNDFRKRFDAERLVSLSAGTKHAYSVTFRLFEKLVGRIRLVDINASILSRFQASLRKRGMKEITIAKHLRQMRAALQWAYDLELIGRVPVMPKVGRGTIPKKMKGRPISDAEFARFLDAIEGVVGAESADNWRFYAQALWFQGLRVGEALHLSWDRSDKHRIDLDQEFPVIWIRGELEKGRKDRVHPLAPDLAELLRQVPQNQRTGNVFRLPNVEQGNPKWLVCRVSAVGVEIGKAAKVVVSHDPLTGKEKFASFHDLRRSCALRWAAHLMPQELMELMRHSSMQVTLDYYVGQRAMETAEKMWDVHRQKALAVCDDPCDNSANIAKGERQEIA